MQKGCHQTFPCMFKPIQPKRTPMCTKMHEPLKETLSLKIYLWGVVRINLFILLVSQGYPQSKRGKLPDHQRFGHLVFFGPTSKKSSRSRLGFRQGSPCIKHIHVVHAANSRRHLLLHRGQDVVIEGFKPPGQKLQLFHSWLAARRRLLLDVGFGG